MYRLKMWQRPCWLAGHLWQASAHTDPLNNRHDIWWCRINQLTTTTQRTYPEPRRAVALGPVGPGPEGIVHVTDAHERLHHHRAPAHFHVFGSEQALLKAAHFDVLRVRGGLAFSDLRVRQMRDVARGRTLVCKTPRTNKTT